MLLYSTGRGTPVGNPIAPAIKLTGSPDAMKLLGANIDADLTGVVLGSMSIEEAGRLLFDKNVDTCRGEPTIAEKLGHREYAFPVEAFTGMEIDKIDIYVEGVRAID